MENNSNLRFVLLQMAKKPNAITDSTHLAELIPGHQIQLTSSNAIDFICTAAYDIKITHIKSDSSCQIHVCVVVQLFTLTLHILDQ